jgi:tetratricopeptide (TPR) repeat protein
LRESNLPTADLEVRAAEYARVLEEEHRDYLFGNITLGRYYSALDRPVDSLAAWSMALKNGGGTMVQSAATCLRLRLGELEELKDQSIPWANILVNEAQRALVSARKPVPNEPVLFRVWRNYFLKLLGDEDAALEDLQKLRQNAKALPRWVRNGLDLMIEDRSPSDLLHEANESGSRFWKGHTHFCVAAYYLSKYDRNEALDHFEKCIEANSYGYDFHHLAFALRDKLRSDPEWPNSLILKKP